MSGITFDNWDKYFDSCPVCHGTDKLHETYEEDELDYWHTVSCSACSFSLTEADFDNGAAEKYIKDES